MIEIPHEALADIRDYIFEPGIHCSNEKAVCDACLTDGLQRAYSLGYNDAEKSFKTRHRAFPEKGHE